MTEGKILNLKAALAIADAELKRAVRALAPKHVGGEMEAYEAAYDKLLSAERLLAEAEGRPYAVPCECPVTWDVGAPLPTLLQSDNDTYLFFLLAGDDEQIGCIRFEGLSSSQFGAPNDETFQGHSLHGSGFRPYQAMRVINSPWIAQLERMNSVHRYHDPASYAAKEHFVFPFHDTTFECVARSFSTSKKDRPLAEAVKEAVDRLY